MYQGQLARTHASLIEAARTAGSQNSPSSNAVVPSIEETQLDAEAQRYALEAHSALDHAVLGAKQLADTVISGIAATQSECDGLVEQHELEGEARGQLATKHQNMVALKVEALRRLADQRAFQAEHRISRQAYYPESFLSHFAWVGVSFVVETFANGIFFQNDQGYVGGYVMACILAAVNLSFAIVAGHFSTLKNSWLPLRRFLGWLTASVFMVGSVYLNSLVGVFRFHFRQSSDAVQSFEQAIRDAARVFVLDFRAFHDLESLLLFFLGLGMAGFAFYKGYTTDDPCFGYGRVARAYRQAESAIAPQVEEVRMSLTTALSLRRQAVQQLKQRLLQDATKLIQAQTQLDLARQQCHSELRQIAVDFASARSVYRNTNVAIRTTPAPSYFADTATPFTVEHDGLYEVACQTIRAAQTQQGALKDKYLPLLAERAAQLQHQAAGLHNELFDSFLGDVEREAQAVIARQLPTMPLSSQS